MFSRSTTTTTTTTTMILVVRKFCFYLNEDVALRSHLYFFFYLIFHRSNTKKLTAMRARTTTIKVSSSFTVVVRCVLSNEDALCVCVVQKHKNPFFPDILLFFDPPWQKDSSFFQSFSSPVQLSSSQKCQVSHCSRKRYTHNKGGDGYKTTNKQ